MRLHRILACALAAAAFGAAAQGKIPEAVEWKESEAPPPPAFNASRLIPFEVSAGSGLKFGVDPSTLSIGKDGVLRYVVVAQSASGTINAMYEGIRCTTGEYKTYARYNPSGGWNRATDPKWEDMRTSQKSRHAYQMARQGGCPDGGVPVRLDEVLRELRRPTYIKDHHN
ncbi:MAG: CNP1-like family protein [Pseudomonadota bacterium]